jgi:chromosome segregation ATPase
VGNLLLFEKRKSKDKSDSSEGNGSDATSELVEGTEEKADGLWVETNEKEAADPTEVEVFESLGQLRQELKEFSKIRGSIRTTIVSIEKLVPRLKERKARLAEDMDKKRSGVEQLTQKSLQLNKQKDDLLQSIKQKKEQKILLEHDIMESQKEVKQLTNEIPKLKAQETKLLHRIQQSQQDLTRITEQIKEIVSIQEYGIDFVSGALVYASQKSKQ